MRKSKSDIVHSAVIRRSLSDLLQVVGHGGDINELDSFLRTPLFYAAGDGLLDIAGELVRLGADVNARDQTGQTPLHLASQEHQVKMVLFLAERGAIIDSQDKFGNTPLWRAVFESKGSGEVIKAFLSLGADKSLNNNHGVSPEMLAYRIANYNVKQFFSQ